VSHLLASLSLYTGYKVLCLPEKQAGRITIARHHMHVNSKLSWRKDNRILEKAGPYNKGGIFKMWKTYSNISCI
jgi:hypothetical protein